MPDPAFPSMGKIVWTIVVVLGLPVLVVSVLIVAVKKITGWWTR